MTHDREPDGASVLLNGAFWVAVLAILAIIVSQFAIMECMERGNWCDAIENGDSSK